MQENYVESCRFCCFRFTTLNAIKNHPVFVRISSIKYSIEIGIFEYLFNFEYSFHLDIWVLEINI